jgi:signal recognition particle subunit SRP72
LIKNGDISESCRVLRSLGEVAYKPGITSTLVTLYLSLGDKESATNLLTEAVQWYEKNKV